jgi:hypothetical protein
LIDRHEVVDRILGLPYEPAGRHCYWLVEFIQDVIFGRALPIGPEVAPSSLAARARILRDHPARADWPEQPHAADGDLVLMGRAPGREIHCGVYLADRGGVIHTDLGHGVVIESLAELRARGWRPSFHRPAS